MKKLTILVVLSVIGLGTLQAQSLKFGIRAGANMQKIDGMSFKDEFRYGYHAGGALEIMFSPKFGIQPEVLFNQSSTQTGYSFDTLYNSINPGMVKDIKLNYLSIPLLLNFRPVKFITLQAGPQFSVLMSQNKNLLENGKAAFKNGDFSLVGGVQLNIAMIRIYGRYGIGLSNLNDIDNRDQWKSQTAQLGVGISF